MTGKISWWALWSICTSWVTVQWSVLPEWTQTQSVASVYWTYTGSIHWGTLMTHWHTLRRPVHWPPSAVRTPDTLIKHTGATLGPLQFMHSVHCSVYPVYTLIDTSIGSGNAERKSCNDKRKYCKSTIFRDRFNFASELIFTNTLFLWVC